MSPPRSAVLEEAAAVASELEVAAMRRAVALAARGLGRTSPNPVVGAVILDRRGAVVGEGWHEYVGGRHAEVVALARAGRRAAGGTAITTLEPCAHAGRTGPCTDALHAAGIARVIYASEDPLHPGGADVLRSRGLAVEGGVLAAEAARGNEAWLAAARTGRPFVTWKYAATLDGRVAAADGTSRWITGRAARADAHRLRAESDAIVVGIGTVLADDPQLTVRTGPRGTRQPLRVVLDTDGRTPATARVRDDSAPTLTLTAADVKRDASGRLDVVAVLDLLYDRGIRAVLLEGGPTVAASFLRARVVDKVIGYVAPALLGAGAPALGDLGIGTVAAAPRLRLADVTAVGADVRLVAYPAQDG